MKNCLQIVLLICALALSGCDSKPDKEQPTPKPEAVVADQPTDKPTAADAGVEQPSADALAGGQDAEAEGDATAAAQADAAPLPTKPSAPPPGPASMEEIRKLLRSGQRARAIATLRVSWEGFEAGSPDKNAALYILGRLLTDDLDPEGLVFLEKLPSPFEGFESLRMMWLARALLLDKTRGNDAIAAIDALAKAQPKMPELPQLLFDKARLLHEQGKTQEALDALGAVKGDRRLTSEVIRARADWLRPIDANKSLVEEKRLLMTYPDEPAARRAGMTLKVEELSTADRYRRAKTLMKRWQYEEAREEFRWLVKERQFLYDARWQVAVLSLRKIRDNPQEAREMLKQVLRAGGKRKEEAYYLMTRSYMREERYDEAVKVANKYEKEFPDGEYVPLLTYYKAWLPYDHNDCKKAIPKLKAYLKDHKEKRSLVLGFHAWCHIRLGNWQQAYWAFGSLIPLGNPLVRGKAHYWRAFAMEKAGKRELAVRELDTLHKVYPLSYYDMLGQQMRAVWEGKDPRASKLPWPEGGGDAHKKHPMSEAMWTWPKVRKTHVARYKEVQRLVELDEIDRARAKWKGIRQSIESMVPADKRMAFVRFMGHKVEDYRHGWQKVTGGKLAAMSNMPDTDDPRWLLAYPRAYASIVEQLGDEFDLPSHFIYAIMRQESRYNPSAVSHTDAVGALQMIPPTARLVAKDMGVKYDPKTFPRPEVSFRYSFFYLRKLANLFKDQLVFTAASYNGGPKPIARWMDESPGVDLAMLVEEFAYNESRIYCRKVAEHTLRYLYLYESDPEVRGRWLDALFPIKVDYELAKPIDY